MLEVIESFKNGGLECDALVGVGVVGGEVDGGEVVGSGFTESRDEGIVGGSEAIVGGDDEHGTARELGGEIHGVPCCCVCEDLFGETFGRATGKRRHSFGGQVSSEMRDGFFFLSGFG